MVNEGRCRPVEQLAIDGVGVEGIQMALLYMQCMQQNMEPPLKAAKPPMNSNESLGVLLDQSG